jgi:hypothetical protein
MASFSRRDLENWVSQISVNAENVMDIGGSQLPIKDRVKEWNVKNYKILDLDNPHETKIKPDIEFDINNIITKKDKEIQGEMLKYDIVFMLEVSEYCWNIFQALMNVSFFLKKDGLLYFSAHFVYPHHNPEGQDYIRLTRWGVEKLMKEAGFEILSIVPRTAKMKNCCTTYLEKTYAVEGMKSCKTFKGHDEIGYLVKCRKL